MNKNNSYNYYVYTGIYNKLIIKYLHRTDEKNQIWDL